MVELPAHNRLAGGSSPSRPTNFATAKFVPIHDTRIVAKFRTSFIEYRISGRKKVIDVGLRVLIVFQGWYFGGPRF